MKQGWWRTLRAQLRDARVLVQESRNSLILFLTVVIGGGLIFRFFYVLPDTKDHPPFGQALHATFALIFFERELPYPQEWYLQILFFAIPVLGLAAVADGVLRFVAALINKEARGQKWQVAMASTYKNHIIICGVGKVCYRVALQLLDFGREVVAVESDAQAPRVEEAKALGIPVIIGDARRSDTLV